MSVTASGIFYLSAKHRPAPIPARLVENWRLPTAAASQEVGIFIATTSATDKCDRRVGEILPSCTEGAFLFYLNRLKHVAMFNKILISHKLFDKITFEKMCSVT